MKTPTAARLRAIHILLGLAFALTLSCAQADVVKPALIEINVHADGQLKIEIRASIEAMLTGIAGKYRNTQEAPNAADYDALRILPPEQLRPHFERFIPKLLKAIKLRLDKQDIPLRFASVEIPERGYTKIPRIAIIHLSAQQPLSTTQLQATPLRWYFPLRFGDHATRVRQLNPEKQQWHWSAYQWIRQDRFTDPYPLGDIVRRPPLLEVIGNYISIGYDHIIPRGLDHILFVLGLFLFSARLRPLLWQISLFTLAHTVTLGLSAAGWIHIPPSFSEPAVALTIAYIGIENLILKPQQASQRPPTHRLILVFLFGLIHGLGFAQALADFGMPEHAFLTALIAFNIGVELGQISLLLVATLAIGFWFRNRPWYRPLIILPGSITIGLIGLTWFIQRLPFA